MTIIKGVLLILVGMVIQAFSSATLAATGLIELSDVQQVFEAICYLVVIVLILVLTKKPIQ